MGKVKNITERAGFEPAVRVNRTPVFETSSLSHSDTSPAFLGALYREVLRVQEFFFELVRRNI